MRDKEKEFVTQKSGDPFLIRMDYEMKEGHGNKGSTEEGYFTARYTGLSIGS